MTNNEIIFPMKTSHREDDQESLKDEQSEEESSEEGSRKCRLGKSNRGVLERVEQCSFIIINEVITTFEFA